MVESNRNHDPEAHPKGADSGWTETPGRLILTQADHLSGEELGGFIEALQETGVNSLQVSPTVTKKNRPGQIILIDPGEGAPTGPVTDVLAAYGLSGFHLLETRHFHLPHSKTSVPVSVCHNGHTLEETVDVKWLHQDGRPASFRIEYDDLKRLSQGIERELGLSMAPPALNRQLTARLAKDPGTVIHLDPLTPIHPQP